MRKAFISLTSDFGVQSQGVGIMEAVALEINPSANIIHLMHGLPDFNLFYAARTMETINYLPVGYHVCVVDPGVGTKRKPIIIEAGRGDFLVGPDNGVLIPATRFLGGIKKAVEITNKNYMRKPVSPVFHGRDIFTPAAAYLSKGVKIVEFGKELAPEELSEAPYNEAEIKRDKKGDKIYAKVISINKFGSIHLNIAHKAWDMFWEMLGLKLGDSVSIHFKKYSKHQKHSKYSINLPFATTFGDVPKDSPLILKDDYGRIEAAINMGSLSKKYKIKIGDECIIKKLNKKLS